MFDSNFYLAHNHSRLATSDILPSNAKQIQLLQQMQQLTPLNTQPESAVTLVFLL